MCANDVGETRIVEGESDDIQSGNPRCGKYFYKQLFPSFWEKKESVSIGALHLMEEKWEKMKNFHFSKTCNITREWDGYEGAVCGER